MLKILKIKIKKHIKNFEKKCKNMLEISKILLCTVLAAIVKVLTRLFDL